MRGAKLFQILLGGSGQLVKGKSGSARSPSAGVLCVLGLAESSHLAMLYSKKPRRPVPPTLLHRTLVFPWGRAGPRPEASRNAHAFRSHSPGYGGFRGRRGRPQGGQPASIMNCNKIEWVAEAPKGRHHQHQRGSAEGTCVALLQASTCAARLGAAPRIIRISTLSRILIGVMLPKINYLLSPPTLQVSKIPNRKYPCTYII